VWSWEIPGSWPSATTFYAEIYKGVLTRQSDGTWIQVGEGMPTVYGPYFTDLATVNGRLLGSGDNSLWWLSPELSSWVPIEGSGDGRMAVADDTVMILNRRSIHRLAIQPYRLLADGFESGDLSAWSVAIQ
jgi:hypothetical protein